MGCVPGVAGKIRSAGVFVVSIILFDADARLDHARERDAGDEANGGDSGDDPVPAHFQISHQRTSNRSSALWTDGIANFR